MQRRVNERDGLIMSVDINFRIARDTPSGKSLADVLRGLFDNNAREGGRNFRLLGPDQLRVPFYAATVSRCFRVEVTTSKV